MRRRIAGFPTAVLLLAAAAAIGPAGAAGSTSDADLRITDVDALATKADFGLGAGHLLVDVTVLHPALPQEALAAVGEDSKHSAILEVEGVRMGSNSAPATATKEMPLSVFHAAPVRRFYRAEFSTKETNRLIGRGSRTSTDDRLELDVDVTASHDLEGDDAPEYVAHGSLQKRVRASFANLNLKEGRFTGTSTGFECDTSLVCLGLRNSFTSLRAGFFSPGTYILTDEEPPCGEPIPPPPTVHFGLYTERDGTFSIEIAGGNFTGQFTSRRVANTNSYSYLPGEGACESEGQISSQGK